MVMDTSPSKGNLSLQVSPKISSFNKAAPVLSFTKEQRNNMIKETQENFSIDLLRAEWTERALIIALTAAGWTTSLSPKDDNRYDIKAVTPSGHVFYIELKALSWDLTIHRQAVIERWQNSLGTVLPGWIKHFSLITHVCLVSMTDFVVHFNNPGQLIIKITTDNERPFKAKPHDGNGLLVHCDWNNTGHSVNIRDAMVSLKDWNPLYKKHFTEVYKSLC